MHRGRLNWRGPFLESFSDSRADSRVVRSLLRFADYAHPADFIDPLLSGSSTLPFYNGSFARIDVPTLNAKIAAPHLVHLRLQGGRSRQTGLEPAVRYRSGQPPIQARQ